MSSLTLSVPPETVSERAGPGLERHLRLTDAFEPMTG